MSHSLEVIYEDNHLLVVNKPTLLATMGAEAGKPSLVTEAKAYLKQKYKKPGNVYLGVVSRLDSFTSGLIVLARTSKAAGRLTQQFANHTTKKFYLCVTDPVEVAQAANLPSSQSWWKELNVNWKDWIWHDDANRRVQAISAAKNQSQPKGSKLGELEWAKLGNFGPRQVNVVRLKTGRKHQIRVQFASRGCPILGDRKYESTVGFQPGIALHSWLLSFQHPVTKQSLAFSAPVPPSWKKLGNLSPSRKLKLDDGNENNDRRDYLDKLAQQWLDAEIGGQG